LALFRRKAGIAGLRYARAECVQYAYVMVLPGDSAKFFVEIFRVLPRQFSYGRDTKQLKIANHGGTNRDQVEQLAIFFSFYLRLTHEVTIARIDSLLQDARIISFLRL